MEKVTLLFIVLYALQFLCGALAFAAPWGVNIDWVSNGTPQSTLNVGLVYGGVADSRWKAHWHFCKDYIGAPHFCGDLQVSWLVTSVFWGVYLLTTIAVIILILKRSPLLYWFCPISFALHAMGGFTFMFRVLGMFRETMQSISAPTSISWSFGWSGAVGLASVGVHFLAAFAMAFLLRNVLQGTSRKNEPAS